MVSDEFRADKQIKDLVSNGFKIRTREHFADNKVVKEILEGPDYYQLPVDSKIVIDIGAHIGLVSLVMARMGAEVYAFEPEAFNYETLCYNIEINGYKDRVHCIKLGVGKPGRTKLYVHPEHGGSSSSRLDLRMIKGLEVDIFQMVNMISIHDVFKNYKIESCDLLKIDNEGAEKYIIGDFDHELAGKVKQISLESHDYGEKVGQLSKLKEWYNDTRTDRAGRIHVLKRKDEYR